MGGGPNTISLQRILPIMQKFSHKPRQRNFNPNFKKGKKDFKKRKPQPPTFDQLMRRFKKKVERAGILKDIRAKEFYEKPSAKRRRKKDEGRKRHMKKLRQEQMVFESARQRSRTGRW